VAADPNLAVHTGGQPVGVWTVSDLDRDIAIGQAAGGETLWVNTGDLVFSHVGGPI
jgi:hypothetical protein